MNVQPLAPHRAFSRSCASRSACASLSASISEAMSTSASTSTGVADQCASLSCFSSMAPSL